MSFKGGFASFVDGYMRSSEAAANRSRLEAQDARTQAQFDDQAKERAYRQKERDDAEAIKDAEFNSRNVKTETAPALQAPVIPAPDVPAMTDAQTSAAAPTASMPPTVSAPPPAPKPQSLSGNAGSFTGLQGAGAGKQFPEASRYAQEMAAAAAVRKLRGGETRAREIEANAESMQGKSAVNLIGHLDADRPAEALQAIRDSGLYQIPEGAKIVKGGVVKDEYLRANRPSYSLQDADGKTLIPDVQNAAYSHILTLKERMTISSQNANNEGKLEQAKAVLDQARWATQMRLQYGGGHGNGSGGGSDKPYRMDEDDKIRLRDVNSRVADAEKLLVDAKMKLQPGEDPKTSPGVAQADAYLRNAKTHQFKTMIQLNQITPDQIANDIVGAAKNPADVMKSLGELANSVGTDFADQAGAIVSQSDAWKLMSSKAQSPAAVQAAPQSSPAKKVSAPPTQNNIEPRGPVEYNQTQQALAKGYEPVGRGNGGIFGSDEILYQNRTTGEKSWASKLFGK